MGWWRVLRRRRGRPKQLRLFVEIVIAELRRIRSDGVPPAELARAKSKLQGTIALGLVVVNVGTLYRLRYVFLIMLIILAAGGISDTVNWFMKRQSPRQKVGA